MQKGFTLIEVLVVVLIIGILTSVALPQYQKAVMRARFAQMVVANNAIYNAQLVYHNTFNKYADTIDELDISLPPMKDVSCNPLYQNGTLCYLYSGGQNIAIIEQDFLHGGIVCCTYSTTNYSGAPLCEAEMGTKSWFNGCGDSGYCHCYIKQ